MFSSDGIVYSFGKSLRLGKRNANVFYDTATAVGKKMKKEREMNPTGDVYPFIEPRKPPLRVH